MWKCPVCGFENPSVTVCPQCRYDLSGDYKRYPTVARIPEYASRLQFLLTVSPSEHCSQGVSPDFQGTMLVMPEETSNGIYKQASVDPNDDKIFVHVLSNTVEGTQFRIPGEGKLDPETEPERKGNKAYTDTVLIDSYQASIGGRALQLYTYDGKLRYLNIPKRCKDGDIVKHTRIHVVDVSAPLAEDLTKMSSGELLLYARLGSGILVNFLAGIWLGVFLGSVVGTIGSFFTTIFMNIAGIPIIIGGAIIGAIYGIKKGCKTQKARAELKRRGISW